MPEPYTLRAAKDQIGAMDPDQRKQLETAVTAQRHGFAQRSAAPAK